MKNLVLIIIVSALCFKSHAQLAKGRMLLGFNFNYSQDSKTDFDTSANRNIQTEKNSWFNGSIRYGYFVNDRIMVGIFGSYSGGFSQVDIKNPNAGNYLFISNNNSEVYSGGLFSRYYRMLGKSKFALFGQLSVGYGKGTSSYKNSQSYNGVTTQDIYNNNLVGKSSLFNARVNPGIVYFITNNLAIETSFGNFGFGMEKTKNYREGKLIRESTLNRFDSGISFSLSSLFIGVNFYFGGKKNEEIKS